MSYCRWSDIDFTCDVYVYLSAEGYTTHVATRRPKSGIEMPPPLPDGFTTDQWIDRHREVMKRMENMEYEDIGLAHDGETFTRDTPGETAQLLRTLREQGYIVPQFAIDELEEEESER